MKPFTDPEDQTPVPELLEQHRHSLERRVLDTKIVKAPDGMCYRIVWYQTKALGSPTWSDVQTEVEEVPCP